MLHALPAARFRRFRLSIPLAGALAATLALVAHEPGLSMAQARLQAETMELTTGFNPADARRLLADAPLENTGSAPTGSWAELEKTAPQLWTAWHAGVALAPGSARVDVLPGDNISVRLTYKLPPGAGEIVLRAAALARLPAAHRQFVLICDANGRAIAAKMLSAADDTIATTLSPPEPPAEAARRKKEASAPALPRWRAFLWLGIEHIWTGYDHLLFLLALLIVCGNFRSIVAIITCFTAAHSLTLALATLQLVSLPGRLTEAAIAASIIFVGAENLWRRGHEPRGRRVLTFAFGLIHGFGFASVLHDLGVGAGGQGVALPLFAFNFGVELGQIAIACVVLPLVWWLRKHEAFVRRGVPAMSATVALAGLYWLAQRTLFT